MIELTERQSQELAGSEAIVLDPWTKKEYVLVQKEEYERLRVGSDEDSASLMAPLLADLDPDDWENASAYERK